MKQLNLFGAEFENKLQTEYDNKINTPEYKVMNIDVDIKSLFDDRKTKRIISEINNSNVNIDEKIFLINAANRHTVFNYQNIAEYYAKSNIEMQKLMERQALVIIDFDNAYKYGYIKLANEIANQYFNYYE